MLVTGSSGYYLSPELAAIVNMAIRLEKPLLLTGEPGTGKTQLASEVARSLGLPMEILRAKSTIRGEEVCYVQDTVLRLNDSRFGPGTSGRDVNQFFDYVIWGPVGRAFRNEQKTVLLIDEIDKTDSDVQDNLLDVLEDSSFVIREVNEVIRARHKPVIILTSNAKRELSDPFLRRCFAHHIAFPTPEEMKRIVALHHPQISPVLVDAAIRFFYELRERGYEKSPATSELIEWLAALQASGTIPESINALPFPGILLKRTEDLNAYHGRA